MCLVLIGWIGLAYADLPVREEPDYLQQHNWRVVMPQGTYVVAVKAIAAVSVYEYYMDDGRIKVTEASIDTTSSVQARFYFMERVDQRYGGLGSSALDIVERHAESMRDRVGDKTGDSLDPEKSDRVNKVYPATTHAHIVEFRLKSQHDVINLFNSVQRCFLKIDPASSITFRVSSSDD